MSTDRERPKTMFELASDAAEFAQWLRDNGLVDD